MEAVEGYWRKVPHVKRLVFKTVPDPTTRLAMLKKGEVDVAYDLEGDLGEELKRDPKLRVAFSGGIGVTALDFLDGQWDPKSPWHDSAGTAGGQLCHRPPGHQRRGDAGGLHPYGEPQPPRIRVRAPHRARPVRSSQGETAPGRGRLSQWLRRGGTVPQPAIFRPRGDGGQLSGGGGDQGEDAHDGAGGVSGGAQHQATAGSVYVWQRLAMATLPRGSRKWQ